MDEALIIDATETLADASREFAEAFAGGRFDDALRFARFVAYLLELRVEETP